MTAGPHAISSRASYGGATFDDPVTWQTYCLCGWASGRFRSVEEADRSLAAHIEARRVGTVQERFLAFHADHPEVYEALVVLARRGFEAGANRLGLRMLFEVVRWEWILSRLPAEHEAWKLNNNYAPWYARLIMDENPWAADLFELRRIRTP